jgi:hypothetical protein
MLKVQEQKYLNSNIIYINYIVYLYLVIPGQVCEGWGHKYGHKLVGAIIN